MTDGNDIPKREAFEWFKSGSGKGMAAWYKNSGPWWDNTNIKANDGVSLEEQQPDKNSLFNFYKTMIKLRKSNAALSSGSYRNAVNNNDHVFSFIREDGETKVLVAINLSNENQKVSFTMSPANYSLLYGKAAITQNNFELKPYEISVWSSR
jgi:glycosidase